MTTMAVRFWGRGRVPPGFDFTWREGEELSMDAMRAALCERTGLSFCGGPRVDTMDPATLDYTYQATLGTPCRGGGYTPEAEVWFVIEAAP